MTIYSLLPTVCFLECTASCLTVVSGTQKTGRLPPFSPGSDFLDIYRPPLDSHENSIISSLSPRQQKSCKMLLRPPKIMQNGSSHHEKFSFCEKMFFAILSIRKPRFRKLKCLDFDPEIGVENGMEPNLETTPNF